MARVTCARTSLVIAAFVGVSILHVPNLSQGEIVLAPGEQYAESRFGYPPVKVDTGASRGYASRAVHDMEASGWRGPASEPSVTGTSGSTVPRPEVAGESPSVIARKGVQEVALIAGDLGFFPKTFFVSRDVPVRLFVTGASRNTLCIMMDSFSVRKQIRTQKIEEIAFTPSIPGKYRFYCPVNGMEGTMIVKELASAVPAEE